MFCFKLKLLEFDKNYCEFVSYAICYLNSLNIYIKSLHKQIIFNAIYLFFLLIIYVLISIWNLKKRNVLYLKSMQLKPSVYC